MDEGDGDIKVSLGDEDEDLRCIDVNSIPLPLLIGQREIGHRFQHSTTQHFEKWGEESFVQRQHSHLQCQIPATSKTTYLLAFSPDGSKVASSHGDHNIYVTDVKSGKCICTLKGHPRSPWCVAFHPSSNEIVASGCLGGEVRVWDLKGGSEVWTPDKKCITDKKSVIASLAFHPTDQVLVIAIENELYFWDWFCPEPFAKISTASKLEKVKYVEFDPLGCKLITGIAIARPERHPMDPNFVGHNTTTTSNNNNNNNNNNNSNNDNNNNSNINSNNSSPSNNAFSMRGSLPHSRAAHRIYRILDRRLRNSISQASNTLEAMSLGRNFAQAVNDRVDRNGNQENDSGTVPGPSSLSDLNLQDASNTNTSTLRRRYLLPRSSHNSATPATPSEEEGRLGDLRSLPRPVSDDSASSSSLDSSSSVTSGVSGASHERNTRLSLLWTSRLNRAGGNESDNSAGGTYDLEERRGEGSVMRGGTRGIDPTEERETAIPESSRGISRGSLRERRFTSRPSGIDVNQTGSRNTSLSYADENDRANEDNDDDSDGDLVHRTRHSGQGGRWMYYRGKFPGGTPSRNWGSSVGPIGGSSVTSHRTPNRLSSRNAASNRHANEDTLAIPGPSGISGFSQNDHIASSDQLGQNGTSTSWLRSQNQSHLDPHFGVQLLSRHIENMQSICRSLSIPRAQLELTRHRNEISQLQQIRSMLYDIQHQIRSLRASVDQSMTEEYSTETLNSVSVNPEPLTAELRNSGRGLTDEVELEVNIGTEEVDQYSYSTLAEEDPDQLASVLISNSMEINSLSTDHEPSALEPIPEHQTNSRPSPSSSRLSSRPTRSSSRALRNLAVSRARNRRNWRNRLVWTGLLRRLPSQRRASRSRLHTTPTSSENDVMRSARRREVRESRIDKRRAILLSRRSERRSVSGSHAFGGVEERSDLPGSSGQRLEEHVRRRHSSDWQRRLRSIVAMDELRRNGDRASNSNSTASSMQQSQSGSVATTNTNNFRNASTQISNMESHFPGREVNASREVQSGNLNSLNNPANTQSCTRTTVSTNTDAQQSSASNYESDDIDNLPERVTRAGPPTTSLSSRIATMLAQQREARNRINTNLGDTPGASNPSLSGARPRIVPSGMARIRFDPMQRRLSSRNYLTDHSFLSPFNDSGASQNPLPYDDFSESQNDDFANGDILNLPVYERLLRLRREIIASRRNRLLRRYSTNLVTGGDLAGATLAEINPNLATEQERQRESFRQERRESYRHMLQLMADRLNHMMNTSFSGGSGLPREGNGVPFDNEDEEGEVMEHQNLRAWQPNSRRMPYHRGGPPDIPPSNFRAGNMFWNDYANPSSALDRHMYSSLFDLYSPGLCNGSNSFYRIQAWDFRRYEIPDISDSYSNIVVSRCRIHFDASVSVSVDGTLLAAVLPDTKTLTRIGVYSLETKSLGQLLYSSNIGFNIVCVSLSPTMKHLVVGISSHRLGVHHNEKQTIGRIYKLSHSKASYKGSFPGILRFCKSVELQNELRQSSLNCIRWIPNPGQGLVYGTNRGQLTVIR